MHHQFKSSFRDKGEKHPTILNLHIIKHTSISETLKCEGKKESLMLCGGAILEPAATSQ